MRRMSQLFASLGGWQSPYKNVLMILNHKNVSIMIWEISFYNANKQIHPFSISLLLTRLKHS